MDISSTSACGNTTCYGVDIGFDECNAPQPNVDRGYETSRCGEIPQLPDADSRYGKLLRRGERDCDLRGVVESRFNDSTPSTYRINSARAQQGLRQPDGGQYFVIEDGCIGGRMETCVHNRPDEKPKRSRSYAPYNQVLPSCQKTPPAGNIVFTPFHPIPQSTEDCSLAETCTSLNARSLETRITSNASKKLQGRKACELTRNSGNNVFRELDCRFARTRFKKREEVAGGAGDDVSRYTSDNAHDKRRIAECFQGQTWTVNDVNVADRSRGSGRSSTKKFGIDEHVPPNRGGVPFTQAEAPAQAQGPSGQEAHEYVPQIEDQRQQALHSEGGRRSRRHSESLKLSMALCKNLAEMSSPMSTMWKIDAIFGSQDVMPLSEARVTGHGRFQRLVLACANLATAVMAFYDMSVRLLASDVDHWCKPPPDVDVGKWKSANIPLESSGGYSRCFKYEDAAKTTAFQTPLPWNASRETVDCTEWQYDLAPGVQTAVSEWDLVCHNAWQVHLITIYYNLGCCIIAPLLGQISDRHGRKHVITTSLLIAMISSATGTVTSSFLVFLLARIFLGASVSMLHINIVVLLFETTSPDYRSIYFLAAHFGYIEGSAAVTLLEASPTDRHVVGALALIPTCILSISECVVFESPRWLLATLNMDEFYRVEKRLAQTKSVVDASPDPINECTHSTGERHGGPHWKKKSSTPDLLDQSVLDLFSNRAIRHRTACVWGLWFLSWLSMYGLWNTAPRPPSFRLALLTVIPRLTGGMLAYAIIERCTRKCALRILLPAAIAAGVAACLFAAFLQDLSLFAHQLPLTLAFAVDAIVELHTLELIPTVMRAMGMCMAVFFARLGVMLSVTLKNLAEHTHACGALVFVVGSTVCIGLLIRWMQETKDAKLAESVYDVEVDDMKHAVLELFQDR